MSDRPGQRRPGSLQQAVEAVLGVNSQPDGQGGDVEPGHPMRCLQVAVAIRDPDYQVRLAGPASEQRGEGGQHYRIGGGAGRSGGGGDGAELPLGDRHAQRPRPAGRRPGAVGGQRRQGWRIGQLAAPVRPPGRLELPRQPLCLPAVHVEPAQFQRRQPGLDSGEQGVVDGAQFLKEHPLGPAIVDDVVRNQDQVGHAGAAPEQGRPNDVAAAQVERAGHVLGDGVRGGLLEQLPRDASGRDDPGDRPVRRVH